MFKQRLNFHGATEVKVPEFVDAIVDITETGSSLRANNLRIVDTIMESYPKFFCSKEAWNDPWKKKNYKASPLLLQAAFDAESQVLLKLNVSAETLILFGIYYPPCMPLPSIHLPKRVGMPLKPLSMNPLFEKSSPLLKRPELKELSKLA